MMVFSRIYVLLMIFALSFCSTTLRSQSVGKGRVAGIIKDEKNDVLPLVTVGLDSSAVKIKSSVTGEYELSLEPGTYTLIFTYASFDTKKVTEVAIRRGEVTKLDVVMTAAKKGSLSEVVITAARRETVNSVLRIQKNNVAVSDVLSIEQIKRTPDNNVAEALRRINGVTIVDNKFVVVRGMGERYNNVLLNGSQVPSTEANKKNFSFDLLPASLIDNIVINKTATPDLPADFAGGIVQVQTKEVPDQNLLNISTAVGYNTKSTFKDFTSTKIDNEAYYGKVGDYRRWYLSKWDPVDYFKARSSVDPERLRESYRMNAKIPNTWGLHTYNGAPIQEYQVSGGLRFKFKNNSSLGFILSGNYRNEQTAEDYTQETVFLDSIGGNRKYNFMTTASALGSVAFNTGKHKIALKNIFTRRLNQNTAIFEGQDTDLNYIEGYISDILTTELLHNRLEGEHALTRKGLRVKWFVDRSIVDRDQPDYRATRYRQTTTENFPALVLDKSIVFYELGGIFATTLREERYSAGADITLPFDLIGQKHKAKAGVLNTRRKADFSSIALRPGVTEESYRDQYFGLPDYITYQTENFFKGHLTYSPASTNSTESDADVYNGTQDLTAVYGMLDLAITEKLRVIGGLRGEDYSLAAKTVLSRDSTGKVKTDSAFGIEEFKLYPSVNLVYNINNNSNIRAAFSKTVSRFDFREGSPLKYFDFINFGSVFGNPKLRHAFIYNYDLRYELYPSASEVISLSVFHKKFVDPIETFVVQGSNVKSYLYYYVNLKSSENTGIEMDLRKSLGFIRKKSVFLQDLFIGGNVSVMRSNVEVDRKRLLEIFGISGGGATIDTARSDVRSRPLQGLSPYSVNVYLLYQGKKLGFNIAYNRFGRRLVFASPDDYQDIYENPRNVLDVQLFGRFFKQKMEVKLNASDVLNDHFIRYNNSVTGAGGTVQNADPKGKSYNPEYDFLYNQTTRGINISLSINYKIF